MATFQAQVEGLINFTFGTTPAPSTAELTQFLTDGAKEVITRIGTETPESLVLFSTTETDSDDSGIDVENGLIISVMRADGTSATNLEPCTKISSDLRYRATDVNSLHYSSNFNPAYFVLDSTVKILPAPSNSTTNKGIVTHVNYPAVGFADSSIGVSKKTHTGVTVTDADPAVFTCGETITLANADIVKLSNFTTSTDYNGVISEVQNVGTDGSNKFRVKGLSSSGVGAGGTVETITSGFPDQFEYLVVLYASKKSLEAIMTYYAGTEEDFELVQAIQPSLVTLTEDYNIALGMLNPPNMDADAVERRNQ